MFMLFQSLSNKLFNRWLINLNNKTYIAYNCNIYQRGYYIEPNSNVTRSLSQCSSNKTVEFVVLEFYFILENKLTNITMYHKQIFEHRVESRSSY
jgi:hypothetical protein